MNLIDKYFNKNKNIKVVAILLGIAGLIFIITFILWELLFSKYYLFRQEENIFLDAVKEYYQYRPELLPDKGEIREITLEKMFLENRIESLYIPNTKDICDTNSWVRVYHNENGEYEYYVYLKCGKYESNIDHEGPTIELNGDEEIVINYGEAYNELGVKSVVDNEDGKIDISKVEIDSSSVNTNEVGKYKVTYKVRDHINNQTKVTRTVIVAKNLSQTVIEQTDDTNYYKGSVNNNYLLFSGMLFRIVNVNSDGTVKLISEDLVSNLRYTEDTYKDSNIDKWLNNVFLESISSKDYLVETEYCVGKINSLTDTTGACSETITSKVGLLSIDEYNKSFVGTSSYIIDNQPYYLLENKLGTSPVVSWDSGVRINSTNSDYLLAIRPVITIKSNLYLKAGDGTESDPYKLYDYAYGKEHEKISSRLIGEYINYSGYSLRIIGKTEDSVKVIMTEPLKNSVKNEVLTFVPAKIQNYKFDTTTEDSIGYLLNNDYIDFLNDKAIQTTTYNIPINIGGVSYDSFETTAIKTKLVLPTSYDLFSAVNSNSAMIGTRYLLLDVSVANNTIFMINGGNGIGYEIASDAFYSYALKLVMQLNGDLKISSGKGTENSPYIVK